MIAGTPSENYYKARKSYLLVSGILGVWELLGINLNKVPVEDVELEVVVRSPEAVPYALIFVLIYLAYRFSIEWRYCEDAMRARRLSKIDFAVAHLLAAGALLLFSYQKWSGKLVGDFLVEQETFDIVGGVAAGMVAAEVVDRTAGERNGIRITAFVLGIVVGVISLIYTTPLGFVTASFVGVMASRLLFRRGRAHSTRS